MAREVDTQCQNEGQKVAELEHDLAQAKQSLQEGEDNLVELSGKVEFLEQQVGIKVEELAIKSEECKEASRTAQSLEGVILFYNFLAQILPLALHGQLVDIITDLVPCSPRR